MSHYAVIDLEMCRIPYKENRDRFGYATEMIQIGAVLLNDAYEAVDTFMTYVHPEFGFLDSFIGKLTGISKTDLAGAPDAAGALSSFADWLPEDAVPVSWSDSDLKQITAEISGKHIGIERLEEFLGRWVDCQQTFSEKMDSDRSYNLTEALNITSVDYEDGEHDALVDAKNTALLFRKMMTEPVLKLSPYLISPEDMDEYGYYTDM